MGAIYTAAWDNQSFSTTRDLIVFSASVNSILRRIRLSTNVTAPQKRRLTIKERNTGWTQGAGGVGATAAKLCTLALAAESGVIVNTALSTGDTPSLVRADLWDLNKPFEWSPFLKAGQLSVRRGFDPDIAYYTVSLEDAPTAAVNFSGFVEWEESHRIPGG